MRKGNKRVETKKEKVKKRDQRRGTEEGKLKNRK